MALPRPIAAIGAATVGTAKAAYSGASNVAKTAAMAAAPEILALRGAVSGMFRNSLTSAIGKEYARFRGGGGGSSGTDATEESIKDGSLANQELVNLVRDRLIPAAELSAQRLSYLSELREDLARQQATASLNRGGAGGGAGGGGNDNGGDGGGKGRGFRGLGAGASIAALGVGLGGFFAGLAAGDFAIGKFGDGSNLKKMMVNLAEGMAAFSTRDLTAIAALVGTSLFLQHPFQIPGLKQIKTTLGMTALGFGIAGFFTGLAAGDFTIKQMESDGSSLKNLMKNVGEALDGLSNKSYLALGSLFAIGSFFGPAKAGMDALSFTLIGAGFVGFFSAFSGLDAVTGFFGADGAGLKALFTNVGDALNVLMTNEGFAKFSLVAGFFAAATGVAAGFGKGTKALKATGGVLLGSTVAGLAITSFLLGFAGLDSVSKIIGSDGANLKQLLTNIADGLNAFASLQGSILFGVGGVFGVVTAIPGGQKLAGGAALGLTLAGTAIAGFIGSFAAVTDSLSYFGANGAGGKEIMENTAKGLDALAAVDGSALAGTAGGILALLPAMAGLFTGRVIGGVTDEAVALYEGAKDLFKWVFSIESEGGEQNKFKILAENLKPLESLDPSKLKGTSQYIYLLQQLTTVVSKFAQINMQSVRNNMVDLGRIFNDEGLPLSDALGKGIRIPSASDAQYTGKKVNVPEMLAQLSQQGLGQNVTYYDNRVYNTVTDASSSMNQNYQSVFNQGLRRNFGQ